MVTAVKSTFDPQRYFEGVRTDSDTPAHDPVCLYLETTNRCNLLCTTCPRTYEELEPPAFFAPLWIKSRMLLERFCTASANRCS
jgi:hypothetical protein